MRKIDAGKKIDMSRSQCFIIIVKYYYLLHSDVTVADVIKLQLLNKRCYNQLIPMAMDQFRILPEPRPCSLSCLEPDIQETIKDKKSKGVNLKSGHVLTLQIEGNVRNYQKLKRNVDVFMK